jgi:cephalosporin hydroxylase
VHGSSIDPTVIVRIERYVEHESRVLVVLDSDHAAEHVLAELDAYAPFVTPGSYLIVDTNVNGNPVLPEHGPGPREAVNEFLAGGNSFTVDQRPEKFGITFNPGGYLLRR